jgi:hypothetical protein
MSEQREVEVPAWTLGQLSIGQGGWVAFADDSVPEWVHVRVRENEHGRLVICELYLARERVDSAALRALPLGRIEAQVNVFAEMIRGSLKGVPRPGVELQGPQPRPRWQSKETVNVVPALDVPAGRKPDGFYRRVAEVYAELAQLSRRPAADMAEASGVSVASVHRWVAEARRRGYLPRAEPGRRG